MCHLLSYNILDVSCGLSHNIALGYEKKSINSANPTDNRLRILTWGYGANGALGFGTKDDIYVPTLNDFFNNYNIKEACCGYSHTVVFTTEGDLFCYGSNEYGQVGVDLEGDVLEPYKLMIGRKIKTGDHPGSPNIQNSGKSMKLAVGPYHNFFIEEDGTMYSWGLGSYGQLGNNKLNIKQANPTPINEFEYNPGANSIENVDERTRVYTTYLSKGNLRTVLSHLVITLGFDSSFILINRKLMLNQIIPGSPGQSVSDSVHLNSYDSARSMTSYRDELNMSVMSSVTDDRDIVKDLISFVSKNIPSLKMDQFSSNANTGLNTTYSKEDEELHRKIVEESQKDYYKKIKQLETKDKLEKKNIEKKEKKKNRLKEIWIKDILPFWPYKRGTAEFRAIWIKGLPPSLRDQIWCLAIGNKLSVSRSYYDIHIAKAKLLRKKSSETVDDPEYKKTQQGKYD